MVVILRHGRRQRCRGSPSGRRTRKPRWQDGGRGGALPPRERDGGWEDKPTPWPSYGLGALTLQARQLPGRQPEPSVTECCSGDGGSHGRKARATQSSRDDASESRNPLRGACDPSGPSAASAAVLTGSLDAKAFAPAPGAGRVLTTHGPPGA